MLLGTLQATAQVKEVPSSFSYSWPGTSELHSLPSSAASLKDPVLSSWLTPLILQPVCLPQEPPWQDPSGNGWRAQACGWHAYLFF